MVTPGILDYFICSLALSDHAVVATPGYHLGKKLQQQAMLEGSNESFEQDLLDSINWPENGYRLFDIACLSGTSTSGFFRPSGESNCLCVAKSLFQEVVVSISAVMKPEADRPTWTFTSDWLNIRTAC